MDYPLSKKELKEIEYCIKQLTTYRISSNTEYQLNKEHHYAVEFLFQHRFLVNDIQLNGGTTDWCKDGKFVRLASSQERTIREIKRCNNKAKAITRRKWEIGIATTIIAGLFVVIGSLISANTIG